MSKYSLYPGIFVCQKCKKQVKEARFYTGSYDFTWMCEDKHLSKINLYGRGY